VSTSVNTNVGAYTALANLRTINSRLNVVQNQIATGLKVSSAVDDASSFAIAQGLRSQIKAYAAVSQALATGRGIATVALAGANAISDLLGDIQAKITSGENAGNSTQQQSIYNSDFQNLVAQINTFITNSSYNGANVLSGGSTSVNVLANVDGSTLTIRSNSGFAVNSSALGAQSLSTTLLAAQALSALLLAQTAIGVVLGNLGADSKTINFQDSFISQLSDATNVGLGSIVDADLARASSQLQAIQVQQQLAIQTLNIANANPKALLSLFGLGGSSGG
jgi:flagellin